MNRKQLIALLTEGMPQARQMLDRFMVDAVTDAFLAWNDRREVAVEHRTSITDLMEFARFLRKRCDTLAQRHAERGLIAHRFREGWRGLTDAEDRNALIMSTLEDLGTPSASLRGDRRALGRWLSADAVLERIDGLRASDEREMVFLLERLGHVADKAMASAQPEMRTEVWEKLKLEFSVQPLLAFDGDNRIHEAAFGCIATAIASVDDVESLLGRPTLQYLYRAALDPRESVWLQCKAGAFIARHLPQELESILQQRPHRTDFPDGMFFRRRAVFLLCDADATLRDAWMARYAQDPAPFVRQAVAEALPRCPAALAAQLLPVLARDAVSAVSIQALLSALSMAHHSDDQACMAHQVVLATISQAQSPEIVLRAALHVAARWPITRNAERYAFEAAMGRLHVSHPSTALRRHAGESREFLRMAGEPALPRSVAHLPLGKTTQLQAQHEPLQLARRLSVHAQDGFGYNIDLRRHRWKLLRDYRWRPRLWRILHELRTPSTDKRQNHSHARGRVYPGLLHVPSAHVAEISPTKTPGEPLHLSDEGGWRPWLPLLDQILSALDQDGMPQPLRIVTSEGVTSVRVPATLSARVRAKWALSRDFARIAALRNWKPGSPYPADAYAAELARHGIVLEHAPHTALDGSLDVADERVRRFFRNAPLAALPGPLFDLRDYFYSIYQNGIGQLLLFVGAMLAFFFGEHITLNLWFNRARARIPLISGGWGTRGKSGTERLKAGVMNALGTTVISKTTGCEAMFLYGRPNRPLVEMFLFRPYDKATIWEQVGLTRMAAALGADVYMWECMGLNPRYVRVLQQRWMRDHVSTITNCFPDHEDIQGPSGIDVPQVIAEFIPHGGRLFTSEENMLPYLRATAEARDTSCTSVDWLQVALLTPDILDRFPYQEHPANIALVSRMCEGLGLERDFALKEMADRVVPDLGVLKTYPEARLDGRRIEFINGMSANERHGTLSNWSRTGMGRHVLGIDPGTWTCTVVNNRADRVARSQVFADILVNDIGADRHFLIGGNLDGLLRFIRESFDQMLSKIDWNGDNTTQTLDALLMRWRIPSDPGQAYARLHAAIAGLGLDGEDDVDALLRRVSSTQPMFAEDLRRQFESDMAEANAAAKLRDALHESSTGGIDAHLHAGLWALFSARLIPVRDYFIKGNPLIECIVHAAPPGMRIRCMGLQNIKGTGLDFVYRWQAWDRHWRWANDLAKASTPQAALAAAHSLATSSELGVLEHEILLETVERVRNNPAMQNDQLHAELANVVAIAQAGLTKRQAGDAVSKSGSNWMRALERLIDVLDAIGRRRKANRIYADLIATRISSMRATVLLQELTQRQKGGWLTRK